MVGSPRRLPFPQASERLATGADLSRPGSRPRLPRSWPPQVTKSSSKKVQARRSKVKTFIKAVNYTHLMPTRYTLDVDVKGVVSPDSLESSTKRKASNKAAKKVLEEKFKTGKNRWFFTKLRF